MKIINIKNKSDYLKEYFTLCNLEWGEPVNENDMEEYLAMKEEKALNGDKFISILGLVENNCLLGFIALFKYEDGQDRKLTPWYASMYVKKEYRGNGYSKILNNAILKEAKELGYDKLYLKTDLENYYEKFGAKYLHDLNNGEKLYCIDCRIGKNNKKESE